MKDPRETARKAIALLDTLGCDPAPKAYAVAYAYVEDTRGPLARDLMTVIGRRRKLDEAAVARIWATHFDKARNGVDEAASDLDRHIAATLGAVGDGIASSEGAAERLEAVSHGDPGAVAETLRGVIEAQRAMRADLERTNADLTQMRDRYEQAIAETRLDPLTQLANRRAYDEHLARDVARSRRTGAPVSLIVLDIDHFKKVNDTYGHKVGDEVIQLVAKAIKASVRADDLACRLGGEEYAVVLPDTGAEGAVEIAERVRAEIHGTASMVRKTGEGIRVSASLGVATLREDDTAEVLFERADGLLYEAKRGGRNRVVSDGPDFPVPSPGP